MSKPTTNQIQAAWKQGRRHAEEGKSQNPHKCPEIARAWRCGFYGISI